MHGSSTTSVRVKYSPSANTCSRGGRSVVLTFLISELSLEATGGTASTDSLARAARSSSVSKGCGGWTGWDWRSGSSRASDSSLFFFCFCCWSFCLRILSSLWTLTGSPSLCSSWRMVEGRCRDWSVGFRRCSSTAEGMQSSHSLVHWLTWGFT